MLDEGNFRHWKVRIHHIIRGIEEHAWTAVEPGWTAPTMLMEKKTFAPKSKERWTDFHKAARKLTQRLSQPSS